MWAAAFRELGCRLFGLSLATLLVALALLGLALVLGSILSSC